MNKKIVKLNHLEKLNIARPLGLCWGGFDLLHSGHINHFIFAKKFCKTLIVAINSDRDFPFKGKNRPFLNEGERLKILSTISMIDYVMVYKGKYLDKNESIGIIHGKKTLTPFIPLDIFDKLKPEYYFKGYEYYGKNIPEVRYLKKFKTKVKFGPKKNVFSSSKIIKKFS